MPEPNRPPWQVATDIGNQPLSRLVERGVSVVIDCESCPHVAIWRPADVRRRFGGHADKSFDWLGPRLRCSHCHSEWVRISRAPTPDRRDNV